MKSATIATALLATIAVAQPHHGHHRRHQREHEKRELVVEWETKWVTETIIVDETGTSTIPAATATSDAQATSSVMVSAAQFYEPPATSETAKATPSSEAPAYSAAPPPTTLVPTTLVPTTKAAPTTSIAPPPPPPAESTYVAPSPEPPVENTYVAPPPPSPTTVQAPPPAPTTAEAPPKAEATYPASGDGGSDGPSGGGVKKTGDMTYYQPGMGSCGYDDSNPTMNVVAVSKEWFLGVSPNTNSGVNMPTNPLCDKTITISAKGKKTTAVIRDSCPGCTATSIDVTEKAFIEIFGSLDVGRSEVTWWLNEPVANAN